MSREGAHEDNGRGRGWVPAFVFTGVGSTRGMGPRIREDNEGTRMDSCRRLHVGRLCGGMTGRGEGFIPAAGPPVLSDCYSWR